MSPFAPTTRPNGGWVRGSDDPAATRSRPPGDPADHQRLVPGRARRDQPAIIAQPALVTVISACDPLTVDEVGSGGPKACGETDVRRQRAKRTASIPTASANASRSWMKFWTTFFRERMSYHYHPPSSLRHGLAGRCAGSEVVSSCEDRWLAVSLPHCRSARSERFKWLNPCGASHRPAPLGSRSDRLPGPSIRDPAGRLAMARL